MERFKTSNALLQNSLSYVGLLSTSPAFARSGRATRICSRCTGGGVLYLTRDTSTDAVKALQERIDRFAEQAPTVGPDAEAARALLAHARLLYDPLPAVDETLKSSLPRRAGSPSKRPAHCSPTAGPRLKRWRSAFGCCCTWSRCCCSSCSCILGLRLRARALALRRRAAFEHVIAENSTRLINCSPAETEARLKQVLGEFSRAIGADRAYVVLDEEPLRLHTWSADGNGVSRRAGLIRRWHCPTRLGAPEPDIVTVSDVTALPAGPVKDTLTAAGVRAWACVPLTRPGRVRSIMGFDAFRPKWDEDVSRCQCVRLAGDAVANAIEREFLERDRARLTTRLERARRMQMVGLLASGIAHNFNNIIAAILGYSEMVEPQLTRGTKPARAYRRDTTGRGAWARSGRQHPHVRAAE